MTLDDLLKLPEDLIERAWKAVEERREGIRTVGVAMGDCGNAECDWRGPISECSYIGAVGPCCPQCREIVEPDAPGVAPAEAPSKPEQHVYTVDDPDLQELLNHVSFLQFAADTNLFLGHDDAMGMMMALEKVEERLKATAGVKGLGDAEA